MCVVSQPPCGVPGSCGGFSCSSLVGRGGVGGGLFECHLVEVLTYIEPPTMISAGSEGSNGNTLMMLVLFM